MLPTIKHQDVGPYVFIAKCLTGYFKITSKVENTNDYIIARWTFDADFTAYMVSCRPATN